MQRVNRFIQRLKRYQIHDSIQVNQWNAGRANYIAPENYTYENDQNVEIHIGDHLVDAGETVFLSKRINIPKEWLGNSLGLTVQVGQARIKTNHEGLVRINGKPYHGIDRNRSLVVLPDFSEDSKSVDVQIELFNPNPQPLDALNYQNEAAEHSPVPLYLLNSALVIMNKSVESLMFRMKAYFEAARILPDGDLRKTDIIQALYEIEAMISSEGLEKLTNEKWVQMIENHLLNKLKHIDSEVNGKIHMVGQSHIDLAWLWPYKETVRKLSRTFSTMTALLEQFPQFKYAQSQPQAYALVKQYYPDLYEQIKDYIALGRWELVGGMWVEPDLNIPSGESLVRQLLYGMRFYEKEFGIKPKIEWLPDTFGYCASLPQLLKKSGLDYFMTTKMNWNDTNRFPYDLFNWVGIDGTSIISYLNHGVNEYTHPKEVHEHWDSYRQKEVHPEQMLLYGHGDGGGGVTREMLNYIERSKDLPGLPEIEYSTAHEFFQTIEDEEPSLPTWVGDMYLELHRGTYTTHAKNKKWNRKAEVLYREAEIWTSFASLYDEEKASTLEEGWKLILLNQFHDIIPGTSIPEVHETSAKDYEKIFAIGEQQKEISLQKITSEVDTSGGGIPVVIYNSLSWDRSEVVTVKGGIELIGHVAYDSNQNLLKTDEKILNEHEVELAVYVPNIPKLGYCTIWLKASSESILDDLPTFEGNWESHYYMIEWNNRGEITRLYDKEANREVIDEALANQLQLYHDRPLLWDAWDIDPKFEDQLAGLPQLQSIQVIEQGQTRDVLQFKWTLSHSKIEQNLVLYHHSKRIDFETNIDWQEEHKLLKVAFPVDVVTDQATFEIPFGTIDRPTHNNTSWEQAQFEVCGHRFADLSEGNYGVSLLNDSKYGYDVKGNTLRLSLLRSSKWPDPTADLGEHHFTYSLYPHSGDWREARTTRVGYELNHPVTVVMTDVHEGELPQEHSFMTIDSESVVLDTIKPSEDDEGLIVRLYESSGSREEVNIQTEHTIREAEETNLLEESIQPLAINNGKIVAECKPYEVKTIRLDI